LHEKIKFQSWPPRPCWPPHTSIFMAFMWLPWHNLGLVSEVIEPSEDDGRARVARKNQVVEMPKAPSPPSSYVRILCDDRCPKGRSWCFTASGIDWEWSESVSGQSGLTCATLPHTPHKGRFLQPSHGLSGLQQHFSQELLNPLNTMVKPNVPEKIAFLRYAGSPSPSYSHHMWLWLDLTQTWYCRDLS
jgi:hypothetical protein